MILSVNLKKLVMHGISSSWTDTKTYYWYVNVTDLSSNPKLFMIRVDSYVKSYAAVFGDKNYLKETVDLNQR